MGTETEIALHQKIRALEEERATLWNRLEIAEPAARDSTEIIHKLEMQLHAVREERDEIRAELKDWMSGHPPSICSAHRVVDLKCPQCNFAVYERDQAQAACAEMRSVLSGLTVSEADAEGVQQALSTDAGKGWISPSVYQSKIEELQRRLVAVLTIHA